MNADIKLPGTEERYPYRIMTLARDWGTRRSGRMRKAAMAAAMVKRAHILKIYARIATQFD